MTSWLVTASISSMRSTREVGVRANPSGLLLGDAATGPARPGPRTPEASISFQMANLFSSSQMCAHRGTRVTTDHDLPCPFLRSSEQRKNAINAAMPQRVGTPQSFNIHNIESYQARRKRLYSDLKSSRTSSTTSRSATTTALSPGYMHGIRRRDLCLAFFQAVDGRDRGCPRACPGRPPARLLPDSNDGACGRARSSRTARCRRARAALTTPTLPIRASSSIMLAISSGR